MSARASHLDRVKWSRYEFFTDVDLAKRFRVDRSTIRRHRAAAGVKYTKARAHSRNGRRMRQVDWSKFTAESNRVLARRFKVPERTVAWHRQRAGFSSPVSWRQPSDLPDRIVKIVERRYFLPTTRRQITEALEDSWGVVIERTLIRHLNSLIKAKRLVRIFEGGKVLGYRKVK